MSDPAEILRRYVPNLVLARYTRNATPLTQPELHSFGGAVGFFDISGFSSLASELRTQAPENANNSPQRRRRSTIVHMSPNNSNAAEVLTSKLNSTLEPVIHVIKKYKGDIIKVCYCLRLVLSTIITRTVCWRCNDGRVGNGRFPPAVFASPYGVLAYYAVKCSLEAVAALQSDRTSRLGLHIGVGVSKITGNHVGGILNRWEYYISGDALTQMSVAEAASQAGQVVISPECYAHINLSCELKDMEMSSNVLPNGCHWVTDLVANVDELPSLFVPKINPVIIKCIASYVPGTINSALKAGKATKNDACMRLLSVLFIGLQDLSDIEDPIEQLQAADKSFTAIQEAAYHVRGTIRQFLIDDKGAVAIAAIGLPPFYYEDNALRAVKMGIRLREKGERLSIGITTGLAFCGSVGSLFISEYAIVGDFINLAARFMSMANPRDILCDVDTYQCIEESFVVEPGMKVKVKGQKEPVTVYRVGQASKRSHFVKGVDYEPVGVDHVLKLFKSIEERSWINSIELEAVERVIPIYPQCLKSYQSLVSQGQEKLR